MGKIKDWLKKYGLVAAVATAPVAGQAADNHTQDDKGVKTEQTSLSQEDITKKTVMSHMMLLGVPRDNLGQVSEKDGIIKNVYKNDKGEKISQYFSKVRVSDDSTKKSEVWLTMHEISSSGKHTIKARSANKRLEYDQRDIGKSLISGEYSETIGDQKYTAPVAGEIGGRISISGGDFVNIENLPELISQIDSVYRSDIKSFEKNNTQSNTSMAFYTKDYTR